MINPFISQCGTPLPTILSSNKIHHRAFPQAYGSLGHPPLDRGSTPPLKPSNIIHHLFDTLITFDYTFEAHNFFCSTFEDSIDMAKSIIMLGTTNLHNSMILRTLSISSHDFTFSFPKRPHTNGHVFPTYKLMINPLIGRCGTPLPTILNS